MKTIFRVAKTELRTLFYSPIAWFLMIVFFIQCGLAYLKVIKGIARTQELGGMEISLLDTLTKGVFTGMSGVFSSVMETLYLYIPLLTMSLISRETGSGTIKLLYSSPVKIREIVLGKYLAMVMYSLVLIGILGVFVVSGIVHIQHPETGLLMTALLGFFLLLCAYSAIGLFMSTLTTYQVVAAIASFVMIGILSYIGNLWQRVGFVRELTYFLSISGRTQKMMGGLLTTKDVVYFIVIVFLFLGFSVYRMKGSMESKPWTVKGLRYAIVLGIVLLVGYVTSIPGLIGYYDATHNQLNTLSPRTQQVVKDLGDDPLEVTAYANLVDRFYFFGDPDSYNRMLARWDPYLRFKSNIKVKTISYYDSAHASPYIYQIYPGKTLKEIADQHAKKYDMKLSDYLTPDQMRKQINLRPEFNRYVMQLKWRGRTAWLRVFDDSQAWPSETELSIVLKRLQGAKMPKVGFVTGNLERDINKVNERDYAVLTNSPFFRYSMVNQGFDVQNVSLDTGPVPAELSALVLADPKLDLSPAARAALNDYINRGGNLLIAGEPGRQAQMNVLLQPLGVQLTDGSLIQESEDESPLMQWQQIQPFAGTFYPPVSRSITDSIPVTMPGAAGLTWTDSGPFAIHPLLQSAPKVSWNRRKPYDPETMVAALVKPRDTAHQKANPGLITFSAADGDVMGPVTTAVGLTRTINNKEQRIIVLGDADFLSNKEINRFGTANFVFCTGSFRWLTGGEYPIDASRPGAKDKRINVTLKQAEVLRIVYIWVVPGLLLAFGTILLIRRKRK
jgi:ABC-2 type transport system permease protein